VASDIYGELREATGEEYGYQTSGEIAPDATLRCASGMLDDFKIIGAERGQSVCRVLLVTSFDSFIVLI
jgi:hypothetical protein